MPEHFCAGPLSVNAVMAARYLGAANIPGDAAPELLQQVRVSVLGR